ncbi:hypothetical protein TELCIR_14779 [Teladorsagia circumcincta]|uniref:Uncharacterized protein n=1 Tax=Teladorsagia circumcincta TaxID=45464 RepID=A0A2G9U061_TELCI|nr:hypothetical protein TELCIR_14779 [Teladorsagia circumcincta]
MAKQTRNVHVHFEAGLPDDDSTDSSDGESAPSVEEEPKSTNEGAKKSPTLEQRLRELSIKYKQQEQSPEREPSTALLKKPFTKVKK